MAQWIKHLAHKSGDQSLDLQNPSKWGMGMSAHYVISILRRQDLQSNLASKIIWQTLPSVNRVESKCKGLFMLASDLHTPIQTHTSDTTTEVIDRHCYTLISFSKRPSPPVIPKSRNALTSANFKIFLNSALLNFLNMSDSFPTKTYSPFGSKITYFEI